MHLRRPRAFAYGGPGAPRGDRGEAARANESAAESQTGWDEALWEETWAPLEIWDYDTERYELHPDVFGKDPEKFQEGALPNMPHTNRSFLPLRAPVSHAWWYEDGMEHGEIKDVPRGWQWLYGVDVLAYLARRKGASPRAEGALQRHFTL